MLACSIQFSGTPSYPIVCCSYPGSILTGVGGDEGIRTPGLRLAKAALSQLSYIPRKVWWAFHPTGVSGLPEFLVGGPSRIRTWDLSLIRGTL